MKDKIRKLIRESIDEIFETKQNESDDSYPTEQEMEEYRNQEIKKINSMSTCKEIDDYLFGITCGFHFPFNPPDPLRTAVREKIEELKNKFPEEFDNNSHLRIAFNVTSGEYKPTPPLPLGEMY